MKRLLSPQSFPIEQKKVLLKGYKLYAVPDWIYQGDQIQTILVPSVDETCIVYMIQLSEESVPDWVVTLFNEWKDKGMEPMQTSQGTCFVGSVKGIEIPSGDFQLYKPILLYRLNCFRFGFIEDFNQEPEQILGHDHPMETIKVLMNLLQNVLNIFDFHCPTNLLADNETMSCLEEFNLKYGPFQIRKQEWFSVLLHHVMCISHHLKELGFPTKLDWFEGISKQIKHFQRARGLFVTLVLDSKTLSQLESEIAVNHQVLVSPQTESHLDRYLNWYFKKPVSPQTHKRSKSVPSLAPFHPLTPVHKAASGAVNIIRESVVKPFVKKSQDIQKETPSSSTSTIDKPLESSVEIYESIPFIPIYRSNSQKRTTKLKQRRRSLDISTKSPSPQPKSSHPPWLYKIQEHIDNLQQRLSQLVVLDTDFQPHSLSPFEDLGHVLEEQEQMLRILSELENRHKLQQLHWKEIS